MSLPMQDDWEVLKSIFPKNWESMSRESGSIRRSPKGFDGVEGLLRSILLHAGKGYSLAETSVRIKESNIGTASAPALQKALAKSESWLHNLCQSLYQESSKAPMPLSAGNIKMRLIDGSVVKEPGKTGSQWLMHYSICLPSMECDYFKITPKKGEGNGESLKKYPINPNDCLISDRGYSKAEDICYVADRKGYTITRVNTQSLPLFQVGSEDKFDLLKEVTSISKTHESKEWNVHIRSGSKIVKSRICAIRKSDHAINLALQKYIKRQERKEPKPFSEP